MRCIPGWLLALVSLCAPASATGQIALMPKIGTPGVGMDVAVGVTDAVILRGGAAVVPYEPEFNVSDIAWTVDMPPNAVAALDLHVAGSGFRVSGGVFYLADDVFFTGVLDDSVVIGDTEYAPAEVGRLEGTVEYESFSPFVSLGYGKAAGTGGGLFLELGVAFIGDPTVRLVQRGGTLEGEERQQLQRDVELENAEVQDDLESLPLYPILNIGVRIGF